MKNFWIGYVTGVLVGIVLVAGIEFGVARLV